MKEKMRAVLRIAIRHGHDNLCMGAFGVGHSFRNPPVQVAQMWHDILYKEAEFHGAFDSIVFAIEDTGSGGAVVDRHDGTQEHLSDIEIFRREFAPDNIVKTRFRQSSG